MKKLIAMLLALAMVFALVACGGGNSSSAGTPDASTPASTPADSSEPSGDAEGYTGESFTIYMATDANENADQAKPWVYFRDLVAEKSGGAVTVEISWGGTEYDNAGIYAAMTDGLLDMYFMLPNKHTADQPMLNFGFSPYSANAAESIAQTNWLIFENEETSTIIANALAADNMVILGNSADGAPSFITTYGWTTLEELVAGCTAFGTMNTAKYGAIGLNCTAVPAPQAYDNTSRGICNGVSMPLATALTNSMFEVAPYATVDGQYTSSVLMVANTNFWNDKSAEAQALIQECVDATCAFSAQHVTDSTLAAAESWKEKTGNDVVFMDKENGVALWEMTLNATATNASAGAAGQAYEQDLLTVLRAWVAYQEEYHGFDIAWEG